MDILILDSWLREHLSTKATPKDIEKYVSLCGPSIEKVEKIENDHIYHIEITTNRIDTVGVYGFARECAAILPRFAISAKLKPLKVKKPIFPGKGLPFTIVNKDMLVYRAMGVVLTGIKNRKTPEWMKKRLESSGVRSLNALVDITNYIMLEIGQPCHAFDYDKVKNHKFVIRESTAGEKVTSFDGKTYDLPGGDIVFDNGEGSIIDLPGIIGTKNSVIDEHTDKVFFFIDNNEPSRVRNTSMMLGIRTLAATINEKGVDTELANIAMLRGIELYQKICKAIVDSKIFDDYPLKPKAKTIVVDRNFIAGQLGVDISKTEITKYLTSLGFSCKWRGDEMTVGVPSFRVNDVSIPEDIVEEVARIYGYHNLSSKLMEGSLPDPLYRSGFPVEWRIKNILKSLDGNEVYTLSLVSESDTYEKGSLSLKNPLGSDTKYLRTDLKNSLLGAATQNKGNYERLFLYELSNVYIPKKDDLPYEKMTLGMCFDGYKFFTIKGILETLLTKELHIDFSLEMISNFKTFNITTGNIALGYLEMIDEGKAIVELDSEQVISQSKEYVAFKPIPKHPPQIEDMTFSITSGKMYKEIVDSIHKTDERVYKVEYLGKYQDKISIRIYYLDPEKTLENEEIEKIRGEIEKILK